MSRNVYVFLCDETFAKEASKEYKAALCLVASLVSQTITTKRILHFLKLCLGFFSL